MSKKGQFYPWRIGFSYPNNVQGVLVLMTPNQVNYNAQELLGRGADIEVSKIELNGAGEKPTRRVVKKITAAEWEEHTNRLTDPEEH